MNRFDRDGIDHINGKYCNYAEVEKLLKQLKEANSILIELEPDLEDEKFDTVSNYLNKYEV